MQAVTRRFETRAAVLALVVCLLALAAFATTAFAAGGTSPTKPLAKNVIIMIADGQGYNHFLAGDYYQYGAAGTQVYEEFPFQSGVSTFAYGGSYDPVMAWTDFGFLKIWNVPPTTESDMAATAMATGYKNAGGLGVDHTGAPVANIMEIAEGTGKATGVVSTVQFNHATPAGFVAHNISRDNYAAIANEMILSSATDVIMGAGNPWYNDSGVLLATPNYAYVPLATWDALVAGTAGGDADADGVADPWTLIQERSAFQALGAGATPARVMGLPQVFTATQQKRGGNATADPYVVPFNSNVPTLAEMTRGALNVLDNDPDGFVAMIEGGDNDGAAHSRAKQRGRLIEEMADFNAAVQAVNAWVAANSNWGETVLIVTADHDTGGLWGPDSGLGTPRFAGDPLVWRPVVNNGAGVVPGFDWYAAHRYATPTDPRLDQDFWHTNMLVPLWAKGAGARTVNSLATGSDPVRGPYVDNTDIFRVMYRAITGAPAPVQ
jgi:alkaline phosphatase